MKAEQCFGNRHVRLPVPFLGATGLRLKLW
ncbi:unnamed protein product [Ectocarpus sp. CCAP 1310/34]|nr:unnamed protein product [Ectocarpus sp. CCAP 1310/34]